MVGNIKIFRNLIIIGFFSVLIGCKDEQTGVNFKQKIIEDNFLEIVDTFAYKYGTFRPEPPEPPKPSQPLDTYNSIEKINRQPKLFVFLNKEVHRETMFKNEIKDIFENSKLDPKYKKLIEYKQESKFIFNNKFPKNIGKYYISFDTINPNKIQYAGEVSISDFKILDDIGYFIVQISNGPKSEIGFIIILGKVKNKWIIIKREFLYIS
jgi:hypothetical protein